ncbi:hypothetical protein BKA66DRAFT_512491 [Pyrenochaeta sp. MPI-SDFR-AT-0127]|nr:hypothetical protein BKA66DRAFT_512491 [Pyrenochaeta sp. MPI-SDFR-AT-0127]
MDFIDENSLDAIPWAERTVQQRQHIIAQAAKGLAWMRTMRSSIPGPVGGGIPTGGLFTLYGAGRTFQTATDMEPWFNHKLNIRGTGDVTGMFDELSMCHMDLSLRNLVLDKAGELWFLDWAFAGFFPPSFEYASLLHKQPDSPDYEFVQGVLKELRPVPYDETLVALLLRVFQVNDGPFQGSHIIAGL